MSAVFIPQAPGSRALDAGMWFAESIRLENENQELRRMLGALFIWVAEHEDLSAYARGLIARRWS